MIDKWDKTVKPETSPYFWEGEPEAIESLETPPKTALFMVDLFCGCGGFSVGFQSAGFTPILGVDIHPPSLETFRNNHRYARVIKGDMRKVKSHLLKEATQQKHISVIAAGVPCQGFSLCNRKRHAKDDRNFLFLELIRSVRILKPDFVLLENVSGLMSTSNGSFRQAISDAISECGYDVESLTLNAVEYGVSQLRQRVFFMGAKRKFSIRWPAPIHKQKTVTVRDAIGDLPPLHAGESETEYKSKPSSDYQRAMRRRCKVLFNHEAPKHPSEVVRKINSTEPGKPMYPKFQQRIRLSPDRPSPTQVSGGIRPQFQFGHPSQPRGLTVRERCRIQSFPDDFKVYGGVVQGRVQTGNAVPPLLAKAIAKQMMGAIKGERPTEKTLSKRDAQLESWKQKRFSLAKSTV